MTDAISGAPTRPPVPSGPPWSPEAVADVHAGVFPPEIGRGLRARMQQDPQARALLAALSSVVDELSLLPEQRMPEQWARRLDTALEAEAARRATERAHRSDRVDPPLAARPRDPLAPPPPRAGTAPVPARSPATPVPKSAPISPPAPTNVVSIDAARRRRRGIVTALGVAAAVAAVTTVVLTGRSSAPSGLASGAPGPHPSATFLTPTAGFATGGTPGNGGAPPGPGTTRSTAAPTVTQARFAVQPGQEQDAFSQLEGQLNGSVADPDARAGCLAALSLTGDQVLGISDVRFQGADAVALAVARSNDPGHATLYILAPGCSAAGARVLDRTTVTR